MLGVVVNQARVAPPATTARLLTLSLLAKSFKQICNLTDQWISSKLGRFKNSSRVTAEFKRTLSLGRILLKVFCLREEFSRTPAICPTLETSSSRKSIKEVVAQVNRTNKVTQTTVFSSSTRSQWIERRLTLRKSVLQPAHITKESLQIQTLTT